MQSPSQTLRRLAVIGLVALVVGACDSSEPAPVAADTHVAAPDVGAEPDTGPRPRPPRITSVSPERGVWIDPGAAVTIAGEVRATTAPIARVLLSDVEAALAGDSFSFTPALVPGINVVDLRVEAEDDERSVDARAFFHGDVHPVGATIPDAVRIHLSPEFLDDDDPDLDDLAGVAESLLLDPTVLALLTDEPFQNNFAVLISKSITAESVAIDVRPLAGELKLLLALDGLVIDLDVVGKDGLAEVLTGPAQLSVERADATLYLPISVVDGQVTVTDPWAEITLEGFVVTSDAVGDILEKFPSLNDAIRDFVVKQLEALVSESIGDLISSLLDGFAYDATFGVETPLTVHLALSAADVAEHGLSLALDARVSSSLGQAVPLTPLSGSLATPSAPIDGELSTAPVAFLIDDDLLNQFLFAYWFGGAATGLDLGPADLAELPLDSIPEVFKPLSRLQVDMKLPLTATRRALEPDDYHYDIGLGELIVRLHTEHGRLFACSISARTGFGVQFTETGAVTPWIDTRPRKMTVAVGCFDTPPSYDPGNVAALLRLGFPPLLRQAAENVTFELPGLELSSFTDAPAFAGQSIGFTDLTARVVGPDAELLLLEASPVIRDSAD